MGDGLASVGACGEKMRKVAQEKEQIVLSMRDTIELIIRGLSFKHRE